MTRLLDLEIPTLGDNTTPSYLADELGRTRKIANKLKKREKFLTEALKARWPTEMVEGGVERPKLVVQGDNFAFTREHIKQERFDTEAARTFLGDKAAEFVKIVEFDQLKGAGDTNIDDFEVDV